MGDYFRSSICGAAFVLSLISISAQADTIGSVQPLESVLSGPTIVIGFVGGFVKHDAIAHSEVQVAEHLRKEFPLGVYTEVLENRYWARAYTKIIRLIDLDRDGTLSPKEKKSARIILYGHSWGASAAVTLARELEREGIPVLLTVQVDSISKPGQNDRIIPANVAEAANFYQLRGFLHGQSSIRALDRGRTHILGNFRFDYQASSLHCQNYPWFDRLFMKSHIQIECDPTVWAQVESLILSRLPRAEPGTENSQTGSAKRIETAVLP